MYKNRIRNAIKLGKPALKTDSVLVTVLKITFKNR